MTFLQYQPPGAQYPTGHNVVPLRPTANLPKGDDFSRYTARLALALHERGQLPRGVIEYLLVGAGLEP